MVGGGNSAGQAAVYLSRHAARVHMLVRGTGLAASMSDYLIGRITRVAGRSRCTPRPRSRALDGNRHLERVTWRNRAHRRARRRRPISNVFLMLGAMPNTEWLRGCVALDENGFVRCGVGFEPSGGWQTDRVPHALESSRRGVFAVGDVRSGSIKRVASSVGEGSIVGLGHPRDPGGNVNRDRGARHEFTALAASRRGNRPPVDPVVSRRSSVVGKAHAAPDAVDRGSRCSSPTTDDRRPTTDECPL